MTGLPRPSLSVIISLNALSRRHASVQHNLSSKPRTTPRYFRVYPGDGWHDDHRSLRRHYRNRIIAHGDYLDHDTASLKNIPFISGHFGFEFCRQFMDGRYSFTFLRDPVERLLSLYFFSRTRDPAEFPIYRAAHERAKAIGDFTAAQILERAKTHLMEFNYIGLAETFAIDSRAILADLNVPSPEYLVPTNVTPRRPHRNDLPAATLRLAQELTSLDAALYEHAKDVRNRG